jgi:hypothetical protein
MECILHPLFTASIEELLLLFVSALLPVIKFNDLASDRLDTVCIFERQWVNGLSLTIESVII